jgi:hypothetical protein
MVPSQLGHFPAAAAAAQCSHLQPAGHLQVSPSPHAHLTAALEASPELSAANAKPALSDKSATAVASTINQRLNFLMA